MNSLNSLPSTAITLDELIAEAQAAVARIAQSSKWEGKIAEEMTKSSVKTISHYVYGPVKYEQAVISLTSKVPSSSRIQSLKAQLVARLHQAIWRSDIFTTPITIEEGRVLLARMTTVGSRGRTGMVMRSGRVLSSGVLSSRGKGAGGSGHTNQGHGRASGSGSGGGGKKDGRGDKPLPPDKPDRPMRVPRGTRCAQCIRANRKCDGGHPCQQCRERHLDCERTPEQRQHLAEATAIRKSIGAELAGQWTKPPGSRGRGRSCRQPDQQVDDSHDAQAVQDFSTVPIRERGQLVYQDPGQGFHEETAVVSDPNISLDVDESENSEPLLSSSNQNMRLSAAEQNMIEQLQAFNPSPRPETAFYQHPPNVYFPGFVPGNFGPDNQDPGDFGPNAGPPPEQMSQDAGVVNAVADEYLQANPHRQILDNCPFCMLCGLECDGMLPCSGCAAFGCTADQCYTFALCGPCHYEGTPCNVQTPCLMCQVRGLTAAECRPNEIVRNYRNMGDDGDNGNDQNDVAEEEDEDDIYGSGPLLPQDWVTRPAH